MLVINQKQVIDRLFRNRINHLNLTFNQIYAVVYKFLSHEM